MYNDFDRKQGGRGFSNYKQLRNIAGRTAESQMKINILPKKLHYGDYVSIKFAQFHKLKIKHPK